MIHRRKSKKKNEEQPNKQQEKKSCIFFYLIRTAPRPPPRPLPLPRPRPLLAAGATNALLSRSPTPRLAFSRADSSLFPETPRRSSLKLRSASFFVTDGKRTQPRQNAKRSLVSAPLPTPPPPPPQPPSLSNAWNSPGVEPQAEQSLRRNSALHVACGPAAAARASSPRGLRGGLHPFSRQAARRAGSAADARERDVAAKERSDAGWRSARRCATSVSMSIGRSSRGNGGGRGGC